ncbi:MAG TPA: substrate-binding domain-containing protein [Candidatus Bathyarchaeia archaeon]|nr:substrate-binding domain-containing protein [Candidatus Bathyarchaeia archaeon]
MKLLVSKRRLTTVIIAGLMLVTLSSAIKSGNAALIHPGTLYTSGSTTVLPISNDAAVGFAAWYNTMFAPATTSTPNVADGGSGQGFTDLTNGVVDISAASKFPSAANVLALPNMRIWQIGVDSVAIIVNNATGQYPGNLVTQLTPKNVSDIFCGLITDWHTVNPAIPVSTPIHVAVRVSTSGTADCFKNFFLTPFGRSTSNIVANATVETENQDIWNLMSSPGGAWYIAYFGMGFLHLGGVQPISLFYNGQYVAPSKAHVLDGSYLPYRFLWYATTNLPTDPEILAWIAYIRGNPQWVDQEGYIRLPWGDFTNATNVNPTVLGTDACPPQQHNYPDQKVTYEDIVFYCDAFATANTPGYVTPLCDWNGDGMLTFVDTTAFVNSYTAYWSGA